MGKKELGNNNLLMRLNKRIGSRNVITAIAATVFIIIFLIGNYICNVISATLSSNYNNLFGAAQLVRLRAFRHPFTTFLFFLFLVADVAYVLILTYRIYTSYTDMNIGQKGAERFTTVDEIKEQYIAVNDKNEEFEGYGGIPVARIDNKLYLDNSNTNTIVLGITRSGKGEMFVVPCIDLYSRGSEKASMVIIDMKLELVCRSYEALKSRGYEVLVLNIADPSVGIQYNPLDLIVKYYMEGNKSDAELLCNSFAYSIYSGNGGKSSGDDNAEFFLNNATSALSALIIAHIDDCNKQDLRDNAEAAALFLKKQAAYERLQPAQKEAADIQWNSNIPEIFTKDNLKKFRYIPTTVKFEYSHENLKRVTVASIVNTFTELARVYINAHTTQLDVYFQKRPAGDRAKAIYASIEVSGDRTKGSIFSQALTKLNIYMYENITKMTARSTFDLESLGFGDKPVALFIGVPFYDRSKDSIVSTLIGQVYQANARRAAGAPGQKCKRKIIFHLDEIGNYPAIKDFKTMVSVGLGVNMIFNLFLQAYSQLDSIYGDDAKTIKANCGNQIYIQTSLYETAEEFSKLLGNETITNITRSGKKMELSKNFTEMYEERPLLSPNELMDLRPGENVVKRFMKRTDLKGNKIVPYPIFNSIDRGTGYLFSYEYLLDSFPADRKFSDIPLPIVSDNDVPEFFNYRYVMNKYAYEYMDKILKSGNEELIETITEEQMKEYEYYKYFYRNDVLLKNTTNSKMLLSYAQKNNLNVTEKSCIADYVIAICMSGIAVTEKVKIISLFEE